jgi:surface protein
MKRIFILSVLCTLLGLTNTMAQEAYAVYTENDSTLTFYFDTQRASRSGRTYNISKQTGVPDWALSAKNGCYKATTTVKFDASFKSYQPTITYAWFTGMEKLRKIENIGNLDTREVTNMAHMFNGCSIISSLNLTSFNTENVTNMQDMFRDCVNLKSLKLGSSFKTGKVRYMQEMFEGCNALESLDLKYFNTTKVEDMAYMFYRCESLKTLDLASFDTHNVTDMAQMFAYCRKLQTIYVVGNNWNLSKVTSSKMMFVQCTSLKGGVSTVYDYEHYDAEYAHVDRGKWTSPGYFTESSIKTYDLYVCDRKVTERNQNDILGGGECSYAPTVKTLLFKKSILETSYPSIENIDIVGLTVKVDSTVGLFGKGIVSYEGITLRGSGTLAIYSSENAIYIDGGATLTVKDLTLEAHGNNGKGIYGKGQEKLVVEGTAKITIESTKGAVCDFAQGIELNNRVIQSPAGATVKDGTIVDADGNVATNVTIGAKTVNLRVAGVAVDESNQNDILGDGAASYDPTTNTLTLKSSIHGNDKQGIWSNLANLTIQVAKNDLMVTSTGSAAMVLRGNTTIQGPGFLSVKSTSGNGILVSQGAKLTIENIVMDVSVSGRYNVGIKGYDYTSKEQLLIRNASVQVHSEQDDAIADFHGGITLKGCSIMEPEGGKIETSGSSGMPYRIVDATGRRAYTVKIGRSYNLWVGGIQVTDANRLDIRGDNGSSYDPVENKLVLTKTIDRETQEWGNVEYGIQNEIDGLTIYVKENITISSFAIAMVLRGSTTIAGGPLTVTTESDACIWHAADLALENVQLSAKGSTKNGIYGFSEGGRLIINNSAIYAEGETAAIKENSKNIILENCRIVVPEGGRVQNGTVVDSDGNIAAEVTIGNPADVNRDGTVDSADIVAVIKEMPDGDMKADVNGDKVIDSADIVAVIKAMK